jgi:hypothetical protein
MFLFLLLWAASVHQFTVVLLFGKQFRQHLTPPKPIAAGVTAAFLSTAAAVAAAAVSFVPAAVVKVIKCLFYVS